MPAEPAPPSVQTTRTGTVNADLLNIRASAGTDAAVLDTVPRGTQLEILGETALGDSVWYQVKGGTGSQSPVVGWVFSRYVDTTGSPGGGAVSVSPTEPNQDNLTMTCTGTLSNGVSFTVTFTREAGFSQITLIPESGASLSTSLTYAGETESQYGVWKGQLSGSEVQLDHLSSAAAQPGDEIYVVYNQFNGRATCR